MSAFLPSLFALCLAAQPPDHNLAAHAAEAAGDFALAERDYEQALTARPDAATYQRLGLVRHLQSKFSEAIPAFRSSLKINPNQWAAQLFLGIDLYRTNQFAVALVELNRASQLKPGDTEIRFWTGVTHLALKEDFAGFEMLEDLAREQPQNVEILRILAEHYAAFGTALLNKVADEDPDSPSGLTIHAQALEYEGAERAALDVYRSIQRKWPDRSGIREAIERLKTLVSAQPPPVP